MAPTITCSCGSCTKCRHRVYMRDYYHSGRSMRYGNGGAISISCEWCGTSVGTTRRKLEGHGHRFCSRECKSLARTVTNYGLTKNEYQTLLDVQAGRCAICDAATADVLGRRLVVDHDHGTGAVRGLLCSACNSGLGHFQDNPVLFRKAISYLERD